MLYVTGKGGVGKTTVAAALGLAAARTGRRTIVCEVAEQDRMSRAFARHGVRPEQEVELAEDLWAITIDPTQALLEWLGKQAGGAAGRLLGHSHAFQYFVAAAPGAKELITIAKVWELAQKQRWDKHNRALRPRRRRRARVRPRHRDADDAADVRRDRARRPDPAPGDQGLGDARRTRSAPATSPSRCPEEMPVNETIELERRLRDAIGLGLDALVMNAMWPERFSSADVTKLRAAARDGHDESALGAVRAALAVHERVKAQRAHLRRLGAAIDAPITTLPFVFESELGLADYERLAGEFAT